MGVSKVVGVALVLSLLPATAMAAAPEEGAVCMVTEAVQTPHGRMKIVGGAEPNRVWVVADYNGLQIRKFTAKGGRSVIELKHQDDAVILSLAPAKSTVTRGGRTVTMGTPEAIEAIRELVGSSPAMFHARLALSRYEQVSDLKGPSMSVLAALAVAATLTGDVDAPGRLTARFLERHRGLLRRIRDDGSCWTSYEKEVDAAATEWEDCVRNALNGAWWLANTRVQLCGVSWLLRAESAWFELGKCNGTLGLIPKIE